MKKEKEIKVVLDVEKVTFKNKTFKEIKEIARKNNEARIKALQEEED